MNERLELYTAEEVARVLRLYPYTVRRLCWEKRIPAFKFGGQRRRFRKNKIDVWIWIGRWRRKRGNWRGDKNG